MTIKGLKAGFTDKAVYNFRPFPYWFSVLRSNKNVLT